MYQKKTDRNYYVAKHKVVYPLPEVQKKEPKKEQSNETHRDVLLDLGFYSDEVI